MSSNIGDDAVAAGYTLVPDTGEEGKVKWGAREINRTRDYIAQIKNLIPTTKAGWRAKLGITISEDPPTGGSDYDIHFQLLPPEAE